MTATLRFPWNRSIWIEPIVRMVEQGGWGSDGDPSSPRNLQLELDYNGRHLTPDRREMLWAFVRQHSPAHAEAAALETVSNNGPRLREPNGQTCAAASGMQPDKSGQDSKPFGQTSHGQSSQALPATVRLDTITAMAIDWLWLDRIPLGTITLVDGNPDVGKSLLTTDLAARVTRGRRMPPIDDHDPLATPASVLVLSAEDDPARTIRPRMEAAGAELSRVHLLGEIKGRPPVLPDDLETITELIFAHHVRLVVIDPLMAYLTGKVDSHKDSDIRRVMHRLKEMAEKTQAAVVLVRHLNKMSSEQEPILRGGGSIGILGAARSALLVGPHPGDVGLRVVARIKGNLSTTPAHLAYRILQDDNGQPRLEWLPEPVDINPKDLLQHHGGRRSDALEVAKEFLQGQLAKGERLAGNLVEAAQMKDISERTLRRAAAELQVVKVPPKTKGGPWTWKLPQDLPSQVWPNGPEAWPDLNGRIPDAAAQVWPNNHGDGQDLPAPTTETHHPDFAEEV